jgi:hypothetical protein
MAETKSALVVIDVSQPFQRQRFLIALPEAPDHETPESLASTRVARGIPRATHINVDN